MAVPPTQLLLLMPSLCAALSSGDVCSPAFLPPCAPPSVGSGFLLCALDSTPSTWWPECLWALPRGRWSGPPGQAIKVCTQLMEGIILRRRAWLAPSSLKILGSFQPESPLFWMLFAVLWRWPWDADSEISQPLRFRRQRRRLGLQESSGLCHLPGPPQPRIPHRPGGCFIHPWVSLGTRQLQFWLSWSLSAPYILGNQTTAVLGGCGVSLFHISLLLFLLNAGQCGAHKPITWQRKTAKDLSYKPISLLG